MKPTLVLALLTLGVAFVFFMLTLWLVHASEVVWVATVLAFVLGVYALVLMLWVDTHVPKFGLGML